MIESILIFTAGAYVIVEVAPRALAYFDNQSSFRVEVQTSDEYKQHLKDLEKAKEQTK